MGLMDDDALLQQARRGSRDAFTDLVQRYQDPLYNMALRILGNHSDAADCVQEAFTRAYLHLPELRNDTVRAWLYRVTINCARDVQRAVRRHPTDALEDSEGRVVEMPDPAMGPEASALQRERNQNLADAITALPMEFRQAVVLRDVSDLSYEEIALTLRVPVGTVKSRISRGRLLLADALRNSALFAPSSEAAQ